MANDDRGGGGGGFYDLRWTRRDNEEEEGSRDWLSSPVVAYEVNSNPLYSGDTAVPAADQGSGEEQQVADDTDTGTPAQSTVQSAVRQEEEQPEMLFPTDYGGTTIPDNPVVTPAPVTNDRSQNDAFSSIVDAEDNETEFYQSSYSAEEDENNGSNSYPSFLDAINDPRNPFRYTIISGNPELAGTPQGNPVNTDNPVTQPYTYLNNPQYEKDREWGLIDESFSPETLEALYGETPQTPGTGQGAEQQNNSNVPAISRFNPYLISNWPYYAEKGMDAFSNVGAWGGNVLAKLFGVDGTVTPTDVREGLDYTLSGDWYNDYNVGERLHNFFIGEPSPYQTTVPISEVPDGQRIVTGNPFLDAYYNSKLRYVEPALHGLLDEATYNILYPNMNYLADKAGNPVDNPTTVADTPVVNNPVNTTDVLAGDNPVNPADNPANSAGDNPLLYADANTPVSPTEKYYIDLLKNNPWLEATAQEMVDSGLPFDTRLAILEDAAKRYGERVAQGIEDVSTNGPYPQLVSNMDVPGMTGNGANDALSMFMEGIEYYDGNGNRLYKNEDGKYTQAVVDANGNVTYQPYTGTESEIIRRNHYQPNDIFNAYVNYDYGKPGHEGEHLFRGLEWIDELSPEEQAGMWELLNTGLYGGSGYRDFNRQGGYENGEGYQREVSNLSEDEYRRLAEIFVDHMPGLKDLMEAGAFDRYDANGNLVLGGMEAIADFFFKALKKGSDKKPKGSGTGKKGYGGGGGGYGGGGGGRGGSYSGSAGSGANSAKNNQNRIYNIMKNWSF